MGWTQPCKKPLIFPRISRICSTSSCLLLSQNYRKEPSVNRKIVLCESSQYVGHMAPVNIFSSSIYTTTHSPLIASWSLYLKMHLEGHVHLKQTRKSSNNDLKCRVSEQHSWRNESYGFIGLLHGGRNKTELTGVHWIQALSQTWPISKSQAGL